jgi:hypothetical protein
LVDAQTTAIVATQGTVGGTSTSFLVNPGNASTFNVPNPGTQTAGTAFNETLTALDAYGNTATGYTGAKTVAFTGPSNSPAPNNPSYPPTVTFTNGVGTASITLVDAQTTTLTATQSTITGTSGTFVVNPGNASTFSVANPGTQTAGAPFNETVTAVDAYGNTATGYTGAKTVAFTGPSNSPGGNNPSYPPTVTFTNGVGTASMTLVDAQTTSLTATQGTITGTSGTFVVNASNVNKLVITSGPVSGSTSSTANLGPITVQEQDTFGNATTTAETVTLSSTGSTGVFAATQGGSPITTVNIPSGSSAATFWYGNSTAGTPTITVSKTGLTSGTQQVTITAVVGLGIVVAPGGTGSPVVSCGAPAATNTCNVSGVGMSGSVVFYVTFVNSSGIQTVYSVTQSSTITETGQNSGSVTIAANATNSNPNTLTAAHTGNATKTTTLTFGSFTLTINVST